MIGCYAGDFQLPKQYRHGGRKIREPTNTLDELVGGTKASGMNMGEEKKEKKKEGQDLSRDGKEEAHQGTQVEDGVKLHVKLDCSTTKGSK